MKNIAQRLLSQNQIRRVNDKIAEVEKETSCEIVTALVDHCRPYHRAQYRGAIGVSLMYFLLAPQAIYFGNHLYWYFGLGILAYVVGKFIFSYFRGMLRLLVVKDFMVEAVYRKAEQIFFTKQLFRTEGRNGILIGGFLFERYALVYGDEAVNKHFDQNTWDDVVKILVRGLKTKDPERIAQAYIDALEAIKKRLAGKFPIQPADINELSDELIIE